MHILAMGSHAGINNILGTWPQAGPALPLVDAAIGYGFQNLCLAYEPAETEQEEAP